MNVLIKIAESHNREYVTPEDVSEALRKGHTKEEVRTALLEVMAGNVGQGCEDQKLCAFIALRGTP